MKYANLFGNIGFNMLGLADAKYDTYQKGWPKDHEGNDYLITPAERRALSLQDRDLEHQIEYMEKILDGKTSSVSMLALGAGDNLVG